MVAKIFLGVTPLNPLGPVLIDHSRARAGSRQPWIEGILVAKIPLLLLGALKTLCQTNEDRLTRPHNYRNLILYHL